MYLISRKKQIKILLMGGLFLFFTFVFNIFLSQIILAQKTIKQGDKNKKVYLIDNGIKGIVITQSDTVEGFLKEQNIILNPYDIIYPEKTVNLSNGMKIIIKRAKRFKLNIKNKSTSGFTQANIIEDLFQEQKINLKQEDIVKPSRKTFLYDGIEIKVTLVTTKNEIVKKNIKFETIVKKDNKLSWRKRVVKQKGVKGLKKITYKVVYYNDKEISRQKVQEIVVRKPKKEVVTQGTYIKLGKSHRGQASWYHFTGKMTAANPWLPLGSYVKVTNLANKKSVIVKIVDRGPFSKGRIIDLEKVAFTKIASLGEGVINIKMEEIKN